MNLDNTQSVSSVAQSCPALCNPTGCSAAGFPVHTDSCSPLKLVFIAPAMLSNHLILCRPLLLHLQFLPTSGSFPVSQFFTPGGQSTRASTSTSVLPVNTQDRSPLGWTGWISLQSKGLSGVFSNTTVQKHQFLSTQLSSHSNSHIHT